MRKLFLVLAALLPLSLAAQQPVVLHSHNDYNYTVGDYEDYKNQLKWNDKFITFPYPSEQIRKSAGALKNPPTWN